MPMRNLRQRKGNAVIEVTLLMPWVLFLFIGTLDLGFYWYSLIAVENAARIAAEHTSKSLTTAASQSAACDKVRPELASLPNASSFSSTCDAAPLTVTAAQVTVDGADATSVSVTYQGISMIPIPGLVMGRLNVTRNVLMRVQP